MADDVPLAPTPPADDPVGNIAQQALGAVQQAQFGVAAYLYRQAAHAAAASGRADASLWFPYFQAEADACQGAEFARNGDRAKSLELLTKAINCLRDEVIGAIDVLDPSQRDPMRVMALIELNTIKMSKALGEMMQDITKEDYDTALVTARRLTSGLAQDQAAIDAAKLGDSVSKEIKGTLAAAAIVIDGLRAYAEASRAVTDREWDKAMESFAESKRLLREASDAYSSNPRLAVQAQMWPMMIETMVDPARNRGKQLQAVWTNFDHFKNGMVKVAHAVGAAEITNNNVVTNATEIQNRIDIHISIVNEFEDRTRDALTRLRDAIKEAPVADDVRAEVLKKIDTVQSSPVHDIGFFEKFRKFAASAAEVVGNIAKVAAPVATAWNIAAPFFGLPILPIPAK